MLNLFSLASSGAESAAPQGIAGIIAQYSTWIMLALMLVAMYFLFYRPQKKKEKQAAERRNAIDIGDEITTIGGVVGRVVTLKEDSFVLETAGDRTRMRFKRWAIQDVNKLELETPGEGVSSASSSKKEK